MKYLCIATVKPLYSSSSGMSNIYELAILLTFIFYLFRPQLKIHFRLARLLIFLTFHLILECNKFVFLKLAMHLNLSSSAVAMRSVISGNFQLECKQNVKYIMHVNIT